MLKIICKKKQYLSFTLWFLLSFSYKDHLKKAREHEFKRHDIIICTCTASSSRGLTKAVSARQIVIDECAMATEPQALIPLVCNKPEKVCAFL
jgi:superfamily I DNA and/or RNA helicase